MSVEADIDAATREAMARRVLPPHERRGVALRSRPDAPAPGRLGADLQQTASSSAAPSNVAGQPGISTPPPQPPRPTAAQLVIGQNLPPVVGADEAAKLHELIAGLSAQMSRLDAEQREHAAALDDHEGRIQAAEDMPIAATATLATAADTGFHYDFKPAPELIWAIIVAAGTVLLQSLTDVDRVSDWRSWAVGVGAALVRSVLAALMAYAGRQGREP